MFRLLLLLLPFPLLAQIQKPVEVTFPDLPAPVIISLPDGYDPTDATKKYPTFFYYHGTSGRPTTTLIRRHTGYDDWLVIGMTYHQKGKFTLSEELLDQEISYYHQARNLLIKKYHADPKRTFVGGFSKGGWHANFLLQTEPTVAGGVIMGGGHLHPAPRPLKRYRSKKPVFIGVGRLDGNYPFSLNALLRHRQLGGTPNIEVWDDLGHDFPRDGSVALAQWLRMRVKSASELAPEALANFSKASREIERSSPLKKWDSLQKMKRSPYAALMTDQWRADLNTRIAALEKKEPVKTEAHLLSLHRRLLMKEIKKNTLTTLREVSHAYLDLAGRHKESRQAKLFLRDHERTAALIAHFEKQDRERARNTPKPEPVDPPEKVVPDIRRNFPVNPLNR